MTASRSDRPLRRVTPSNTRGPPSCRVCTHPERVRIELQGLSGVSHVVIAKKFSTGDQPLSRYSIDRHFLRHMTEQRRAQLVAGPMKLAELVERANAEGHTLIDYLAMLRSSLSQQYLACAEAGDSQGAAILAARLLETLRMGAQLNGDLTRAAGAVTNNTLILGSPIMADLQAMLIARLRPFPEAARAVMEGLEQLSARALNGAAAQARAMPALEAPAA
jgi:hypothetical protein